ncbi:exonuclease [Fusarium tricinctum]|uniref:Exonuclease n=1 Tax=Fusarium tricinctum TaxID=61284 RepID=A0A8K0WBF5_9HYPO|nr:exonuclease [Fusarium tricinctum]
MALSQDTITQRFTTVKLEDKPAIIFVNSTNAIAELVNSLNRPPTVHPSIFIDLKGINLSRHRTILTMQVYHLPSKYTYLINIYTLGNKYFSTPGSSGRTLKEILESNSVTKVFFNVHNDSDILYGHYQIILAGIHDLQLIKLLTQSFSRKYISRLSKYIKRDAPLSTQERLAWYQTKESGLRLFTPEKGGRYKSYYAQDIQILPRLFNYYNEKISQEWHEKIIISSKARVQSSQSATYNGVERHMALAPIGW